MISGIAEQTRAAESGIRAGTPEAGGLLVGVDGSPESIAAFNTAALVSRQRRCSLHVVSIIPSFPVYRMGPGEDRSGNVDALRVELRESALRDMMRAAQADPAWTQEVAIGRPAGSLVQIASDRGSSLIVVGRRNHGLMDRITGGETTLQVMRLAGVPVLAVPEEVDAITSAVVAMDFSPSSIRAARGALDLLEKTATLYLVHVEPPTELLPGGFSFTEADGYPEDISVRFRRLIESLNAPAGIICEPVVLNGKPVRAIVEFGENLGVGLIAAGSHGHAPIERFLLGSVSTGLVRNASCPVLVAPGGD